MVKLTISAVATRLRDGTMAGYNAFNERMATSRQSLARRRLFNE